MNHTKIASRCTYAGDAPVTTGVLELNRPDAATLVASIR